ncbi:hypothetical protein GCK32_007621 [Trichostrongylus colubriformis]|uniref:Uncharacterized protein n=1 Tax=Trichostrongylus colubriformis TaxID=6319 RepID=A0AAN8FAK0_TRICO
MNGAVRCLKSFAQSGRSGAVRLIGVNAMQVICDLVTTDWSVTAHIHSDLRSNRQLTVDLLALYATLLTHIRRQWRQLHFDTDLVVLGVFG